MREMSSPVIKYFEIGRLFQYYEKSSPSLDFILVSIFFLKLTWRISHGYNNDLVTYLIYTIYSGIIFYNQLPVPAIKPVSDLRDYNKVMMSITVDRKDSRKSGSLHDQAAASSAS